MRATFVALAMIAAALVARAGDAPARFETDEPLRAGMIAIRDLVRTNHSLVTHRRMPPDHAARFARQISAEADAIRGTTRISGAARAKLDALLAEITGGVAAVAKPSAGTAAIDGLVRADEALARYPQEFEHPGWAPVQALP